MNCVNRLNICTRAESIRDDVLQESRGAYDTAAVHHGILSLFLLSSARSTRGSYVFSSVCLSTGGVPIP